MKRQPVLSIILCTYNRADLLHDAIKSLLEQSIDKSLYEIVIVDNASTDHTRRVVEAYQCAQSAPTITLISEPVQGLGYARNTGCQHAAGIYFAFMDDDCVATDNWLEILLDCYERVNPSPWGVGGAVIPVYDKSKPEWFKDSYETDTWGDDPRFLAKGESFTGCNMSFRKGVIEKFGGFDVELGMKGMGLALAEDTKLFRNIWSKEGDQQLFYYTPRAIVHHRIDPYKMTVLYRLKRAYSAGQASWTMAQTESFSRRLVLCVGSVGLMLWYAVRAVLLLRPRHLQTWAVEEVSPLVSNIGRVFASLGLRKVFRQRNTGTAVF